MTQWNESVDFGYSQVPAFVDISSSPRRCGGDADIVGKVPAPTSVARPLVGECRACSEKIISVKTLSAELEEAHRRIRELQKQLQESQQALLVHLASESLKHRESPQELSDSFGESSVEGLRKTGEPTAEVSPTPSSSGNLARDVLVAEVSTTPSSISGSVAGNLNCNVNVPELIRCAERGEEKAVETLLRNGEDPNSTDDMGIAALHGAAKKGRLNVVLLLLHAQANPNIVAAWRGETPLHYACKYGHENVARLLLLSKARPDVKSQEDKTPLQYAREKKHKAVENAIEEAIRCLQRKA
jgi:hypothetical protein